MSRGLVVMGDEKGLDGRLLLIGDVVVSGHGHLLWSINMMRMKADLR